VAVAEALTPVGVHTVIRLVGDERQAPRAVPQDGRPGRVVP
jgi:hypothetical protein